MLENPAPFSLNFSSPVTYSSKEGKILPQSPLPSTPPPKPKNPHENACTLPNNHYYM